MGIKRPRILLICCNHNRDLTALKLLKSGFEKELKAKTIIVGSVVEIQRMNYLIFQYKPHVVILPQIQEQSVRGIAEYIKSSGGIVCVVPSELTIADSLLHTLVNKKMAYDKLVDGYFFPGENMYSYFKRFSGIEKDKLFITGSPKIDVTLKKLCNPDLSRSDFCSLNKIPKNRKNIFVLTSFPDIPDKYIKSNIGYSGDPECSLRFLRFLKKTKKQYLEDVKRLCDDFSDCNVVLKPHPQEDITDYKNISRPNYFLLEKNTIQDCLPAIDIAIHWNSTASTECWIFGKKTIQYDPIKETDDFLSGLKNGNLLCFDYPSLKKAVQKYLEYPLEVRYLSFQRKYLREVYGNLDGNSSTRIAKLIRNQLLRKLPQVKYQRHFSSVYPFFLFFEKIISHKTAGRLAALLKHDYDWKYASENRVLIT